MTSNPPPHPDFALLFKRGRSAETFAHGAQIFKEGDPGDQMYIVLKGEVEIRVGGASRFLQSRPGIFSAKWPSSSGPPAARRL
ncbi:MAG: cyclic nucleotide-binding domain-containing protein [Alphaproteobacteria bacterium]|nr:cyclic nucleotide-binding domain-containing protein [Alphaproteobacteria bacterium]